MSADSTKPPTDSPLLPGSKRPIADKPQPSRVRLTSQDIHRIDTTTQRHIVTPVTSDFEDNWTTQVRKGVIELCVLNALGRSPLRLRHQVAGCEADGMFINEAPSTRC